MSIKNRTIYAYDCLDIMNDEVALPSQSVDLIYLDPPFNSESTYNLPFKGEYRDDAKPVSAFTDTWKWGSKQDKYLTALGESGPVTQRLAELVELVQRMEYTRILSGKKGGGVSAYLVNMATRIIPMKRILKDTGTIYLHCDPTASHYLKIILDCVWGGDNFGNEIIWCYAGGGQPRKDFPRKHDVIFRYGKTSNKKFNKSNVRVPYDSDYKATVFSSEHSRAPGKTYTPHPEGKVVEDWWTGFSRPYGVERLGYPTQKPLDLLKRIILASTDEGDVVLDPFCGCGTTVHAAEDLRRKWIGIDISRFSTGLIKERILSHFKPNLSANDVEIHGTPKDIPSAKKLAKECPYEFEKWICGEIGAHGMFKDVGAKGSDRGVDGVIDFGLFEGWGSRKVDKGSAIVQVKGGDVHPDSVRALYATVKKFGATAGIFVCFEKYMKTVENNKNRDMYTDHFGQYPVIQGFSVEQLINNEKPILPQLLVRDDAKMTSRLFE